MGWRITGNTLVVLIALFNVAKACPKSCTCKWKNGKQTVDCTNKGLLDIPEDVDVSTQVLEFSGNKLKLLSNELFARRGIDNLQRIYLARCYIRIIEDSAFKGLTNLVELDLSGNSLEVIPTATFHDTPSLMRLILNSNPVKTLKRFSFNHLSYLNTLELSNCELTEVDEGAFQGLHSLEWLHLDGNRLKTLRGRRTLPENLKGVDLQGNAWECDCHIQDLYAWLKDFNIPLSVEPLCNGPFRMTRRSIKSIQIAELACLPDITPTTFYLELNEGKNISLVCHVHAIPEATVSWWFQGQLLQNNTIVAPGVHLIYFIEEGSENKRSELFIYNTDVGDNGTFICNAENAAGKTQSNFTIKIVLKEEPIVIIVSLKFEYLLAAIVGITVLGLAIVLVILIMIIKYRRIRRRQMKRDKTKEVTLQYQQNISKCAVLQEAQVASPEPLKVHTTNAPCTDDVILYRNYPHSHEDLFRKMSPTSNDNQVSRSPLLLGRYQLEQNPDIINGTESIGWRQKGDGESEDVCEQVSPSIRRGSMPVSTNSQGGREMYTELQCILDPEGYPVDYGLPRQACSRPPLINENIYRTLPTNRMKRHSAANPLARYSREAEFLSRASQPIPYDHFHADVRYTADGYPERSNRYAESTSSSPPESFRSENAATYQMPCCSMQWTQHVPANLHVINSDKLTDVSKRCVGAQTDNEGEADLNRGQSSANNTAPNVRNDAGNEMLTESPDEGYEGEPSVV